ncbi:hypothetical protein [Streptomyces calidiresistens]|uniref:Uncharacterized protein n=1 Tax=Streptomyces calidiresistens TaxID=1485586 RepID=A0A7W3T0H8_9ACTN|nr:hypothetical protein [Streptomyces calidiresistens]MBB0228631.1 hypothetical protein [Streptomyces calidiresistens]
MERVVVKGPAGGIRRPGRGPTFDDGVEEVVHVIDTDSAFAAPGAVREAAFGTGRPGRRPPSR